MAKKQAKKSATIDELAMMVQNGFQELRQEVHNEVGSVRGKIDDLREETRLGFKRVDGSLMRVERRLEYQDEENFEMNDRLKIVEKKVGIKPRRS
ncbi:MAG: hypothetical protein Q7S04_04970 [Candidatus Moranbacteria bacterium]|nr:hypothetical protein [Candidatus Moranbacteria bacterium]